MSEEEKGEAVAGEQAEDEAENQAEDEEVEKEDSEEEEEEEDESDDDSEYDDPEGFVDDISDESMQSAYFLLLKISLHFKMLSCV